MNVMTYDIHDTFLDVHLVRKHRELLRAIVAVRLGIGMRKVNLRALDAAYSIAFPKSTPINVNKKRLSLTADDSLQRIAKGCIAATSYRWQMTVSKKHHRRKSRTTTWTQKNHPRSMCCSGGCCYLSAFTSHTLFHYFIPLRYVWIFSILPHFYTHKANLLEHIMWHSDRYRSQKQNNYYKK